jgi:hypothetical protein
VPPNRSWGRASIAVVIATIAANGAGYLIYQKQKQKPHEAVITIPPKSTTTDRPASQKEGTQMKTLAIEARDRGIAALRDGNFDQAVTSLELAHNLDGDLADVVNLLEVARKLQRESAQKMARAETAAPEEESPKRAEPQRRIDRTPRRVAARVQQPHEEPVHTVMGVLLVTTTPPKLLVKVDGAPKDLSPARVELEPGPHRLQIVRGNNEVVLERTVDVSSGLVSMVSENFPEPPLAAKADKPERGLPEERLDLVKLADRSDISSKHPAANVDTEGKLDLVKLADANRLQPSDRKEEPGPAPRHTPNPSLYIVGRKGIERSLAQSMHGIEVRAFGTVNELRTAMSTQMPDAIFGAPSAIQQAGFTPSMVGTTSARGGYAIASFRPDITRDQLGSITLGTVEESGKKATEQRVNQLIGGKAKLRRVQKVDDLLPLLQFKMADAIVVRDAQLAQIKSRTKQTLHTISLTGPGETRAVAFTDGGRRSVVERALLDLAPEARAQLGVEKWSSE